MSFNWLFGLQFAFFLFADESPFGSGGRRFAPVGTRSLIAWSSATDNKKQDYTSPGKKDKTKTNGWNEMSLKTRQEIIDYYDDDYGLWIWLLSVQMFKQPNPFATHSLTHRRRHVTQASRSLAPRSKQTKTKKKRGKQITRKRWTSQEKIKRIQTIQNKKKIRKLVTFQTWTFADGQWTCIRNKHIPCLYLISFVSVSFVSINLFLPPHHLLPPIWFQRLLILIPFSTIIVIGTHFQAKVFLLFELSITAPPLSWFTRPRPRPRTSPFSSSS